MKPGVHELVPSVSIENMLNQRQGVLSRVSQAVALIAEATAMARAANLGMPQIMLSGGVERERTVNLAGCRLKPARDGSPMLELDPSDADDIARGVRLGIDVAAWQYLMSQSGMRTFMDTEARRTWDDSIRRGEVPELTMGNVLATFEQLHASRGDLFERGVLEVFRTLSWVYKSNQPQKFGKVIVLKHVRGAVVAAGRHGHRDAAPGGVLGYVSHDRVGRLDDLTRVHCILDGQPEPDHREGWWKRLAMVKTTSDPHAADAYLEVRSFRNGNVHVHFKRPDLVDRMNLILAKHYPGALPAPKGVPR